MKTTFRRALAVLLGMLMLATCVLSISATKTYTDVKNGDWYYEFVTYMSDKGIINGYTSDNTFRPNNYVKRSEFIKMMVETFGLDEEATISYTDVKNGDWYYEYYRKAKAQGFIDEVFTGISMLPGEYLTREEAAALLMAYMDYPEADKASTSKFADYSTISAKYRDYVLQAAYAGIINGFEDGNVFNFRPKETLRRAQAAKILSVAAGTIADDDIDALDFDDSDNLVVTAGVVIENVTVPGNVIISEGVTGGTVTFIDCTIEGTVYNRSMANVVFSDGEVSQINIDTAMGEVSLKQGAKVETLNVNSLAAQVSFYNSSSVERFIIADGSTGVKIVDGSDNGSIDYLEVNANGLVSAIKPSECKVDSGVSATIASEVYSAGLKGGVFTSWASGVEYLNFELYKSGTLQYYFTTTKTAPSASDFSSKYSAATKKDSITVVADKEYSEVIGAESLTSYPYLVVAMVSGGSAEKPVVIDRNAAKSAFTTIPTLGISSGSDVIKLTPKVKGTLYYYYTNDATVPATYAAARTLYNGVGTTIKGTIAYSSTTASTKTTKAITALEGYVYCVIFYVDTNGGEYDPILLERPAMTDGFKVDPVVNISKEADGEDVLKFTISSKATVKWLYTNSSVSFTASYFDTAYATAPEGTKGFEKNVPANQEQSIKMMKRNKCDYSYVVVMLVVDGTSYVPVKVSRTSTSTGFESTPAVYKTNGNDVIVFETAEKGTLKYLYTNKTDIHNPNAFNTAFDAAKSGKYTATISASGVNTFSVGTAVEGIGSYVSFMFTDGKGNNYVPVTVKRKDVGTGMSTTPVAYKYKTDGDKTSELVIKAVAPMKLYYFETNSNYNYTLTPDLFTLAANTRMKSVNVKMGEGTYTNLNSAFDIEGDPKYIAIMLEFDGNTQFMPIVIDCKEISYGVSSIGVDKSENNEDVIKVTGKVAGKLEFYYSNTLPKDSAAFTSAYKSASFKSESYITTAQNELITWQSGAVAQYKYLVYRLTGDDGVVYTPGSVTIGEAHRRNATITLDGKKLDVSTDLTTYKVLYFYSDKQIENLTVSGFLTQHGKGLGAKTVTVNEKNPLNVTVYTQKEKDTYKYLYVALQDNAGTYLFKELQTPAE
ncbi:MAG: S-layer homology domain-containing protein [Ruminococcaceae bacterium]|nr:S-layer homology domain-containing protein [Oscillospiraceae bacterium]